MIRRIAQALTGRKILRDWLGEGGKPVATELAQERTNICRQCPHNYKGEWLWTMATQLAINSQMQLRRAMKLQTLGEEDLKTCEICGCKLKLKIHTPILHLQRHTTIEKLNHYPNHCWIRKEATT